MDKKNLIVTLDDNKKYSLIKAMEFEGKKYIYLIDIDDFKNIIIGEVNVDEVTIIDDSNLFGQLFLKFSEMIEKDTL